MESSVLSQAEIDALMSLAMSDSASPPTAPVNKQEASKQAAKIKAYDFRHPDKFSKDHMRSLQLVHDSFANVASASLSGYLRSTVQLTIGSVEQVMNDEYLPRIPELTVLYVVRLEPLPGRAILQMGLNVCFALADRLLGGPGRPLLRPREISEVELTLLERVTLRLLAALADAWQNLAEVKPEIEEVVLSPQFLQDALPNDALALFSFELKVGEVNGLGTLALPFPLLEPILNKLSTRLWFVNVLRGGVTHNDSAGLAKLIGRVKLPVHVELGGTNVTVRELIDLREQDIFFLDSAPGDDLTVMVGRKPRFRGRPGLVGNKLGVEITAVMTDELEDALAR